MSRKKSKSFLFQNLVGKSIKFSKDEQTVIDGLKPLKGGEWNGKIKSNCTVKRIERDTVVNSIKPKLLKIQGRFCIYCGIHEKYCGPLEREHIAPKGKKSYPEFMFEPQNLALACHHCNVDLKGEQDTISTKSNSYSNCEFNIVHPYFDQREMHILFATKSCKVLLKAAPKSKKGKFHIKLFELDSVANTVKRSGLFMYENFKISSKYDNLLIHTLNEKHLRI
ncbi:HNH endonuclease [Aquirufa sp. Wall-65K1]